MDRVTMAGNSTPRLRAPGEWQVPFLRALAANGNIRASCKAAGIDRTTAYVARGRDAVFAAAWDAALEDAIDDLELVARQRAKRQSDTLLMFLLRSHRPERYREVVRNELSGVSGAPVEVRAFDYQHSIAPLVPAAPPDGPVDDRE